MRAGFVVAFAAGLACARVEVPQTGHLGSGRIQDLAAVPEDLGRRTRDDRDGWRSQAAESIVSTARAEGRLEAACEVTILAFDTASGKSDVRIDYKEGPEYSFGNITFEFPDRGGALPPDPGSLPARTGQTFQQAKLNLLVQETQKLYRHQGWLDANVMYTLEVRKDSQKVDVRMDVGLGKIAIFDNIEVNFHGRHLTSSSRLTELWPLAAGDTIRNEDLQRYNRKLAQTRLFNQAKITRQKSSRDSTMTDVVLDMGERIPGTIDLSLSWEPTFGWGVGGLVRHRNVLGSFNELSAQTKIAEGVQSIRGGHYNPLLLGSPIALDDGITIQQQKAGLGDPSIYRELTIAGDGTFGYLPTDWTNLSLKLGTQRDTKYKGDGSTKITYQISADFGWTLDFRDEPFDPLQGWTVRTDLGWGDQFYPKDTTYTWIQSQAKLYQPLFWRFLSAFALEGGAFLSPTTFDASKIFWMGGPRTVRSYGYDELRTDTSFTNHHPLQPRYIRASAELRMNLPWSLQLVGFLDGARIWNKGQEPLLWDAEQWKKGYGPGIRYRFSLLSFRLDYSLNTGVWAFDLAQAI